MKKLAFIMLISLIPFAHANHIPLASQKSDEGIFDFYSKVLSKAEKCLEGFNNEKPDLNLSKETHQTIETLSSEIAFYDAKGVRSNASIALKPFLSFSDSILRLTSSQKTFLKSIPAENPFKYQNAVNALKSMELALDEIYSSIEQIEKIEYWNESSKLKFDTSKIREEIQEAQKLLLLYKNLLGEYEKEFEGIFVYVSNFNPFVHEDVKISVHCVNVTFIAVFIENKAYNKSELTYKFDKEGIYRVYAEGSKGMEIVRSNIVEVSVRKIPTKIILLWRNAYINEEIKLRGYLLNYYGNPIDSDVFLKLDNTSMVLNGKGFEIPLKRESEGYVKVFARYEGSETYNSSEAEALIFFSRLPVTLRIEAEKRNARVNELVEFYGSISIERAKIYVKADSKDMELTAFKNFSFNLSFEKPGKYVVSAYFPGDAYYQPASSKVEITVAEAFELWYFLIAAILFGSASIFGGRVFRFRNRRLVFKEIEKKEVKRFEEKTEMWRDISKAYETLFKKLADKFGLSLALTPRELLNALKDKDFLEKLIEVTEMHERAVYGEEKIDEETYFRLIKEVLEGFR